MYLLAVPVMHFCTTTVLYIFIYYVNIEDVGIMYKTKQLWLQRHYSARLHCPSFCTYFSSILLFSFYFLVRLFILSSIFYVCKLFCLMYMYLYLHLLKLNVIYILMLVYCHKYNVSFPETKYFWNDFL